MLNHFFCEGGSWFDALVAKYLGIEICLTASAAQLKHMMPDVSGSIPRSDEMFVWSVNTSLEDRVITYITCKYSEKKYIGTSFN